MKEGKKKRKKNKKKETKREREREREREIERERERVEGGNEADSRVVGLQRSSYGANRSTSASQALTFKDNSLLVTRILIFRFTFFFSFSIRQRPPTRFCRLRRLHCYSKTYHRRQPYRRAADISLSLFDAIPAVFSFPL